MSILKSILHGWNKTTNSYDTLHPETESSQITDWSQGVANTLASTALGSLISTLSSDSLAAKIMKLVLDATGVKYLMGTNGYICFGSLFGGLIIQWGYYTEDSGETTISTFTVQYPITYNAVYSITTAPSKDDTANVCRMSTSEFTVRCHQSMNPSYWVKRPFTWIAVGK